MATVMPPPKEGGAPPLTDGHPQTQQQQQQRHAQYSAPSNHHHNYIRDGYITQGYGKVGREQRFSRYDPCPICGGYDDRRLGDDRCWGYLSGDGRSVYCTNAARAGGLPKHTGTDAYRHWLGGTCYCGQEHESAPDRVRSFATAKPAKRRLHIHRTPIAEHYYHNADGTNRFRVVRFWSGEPPHDSPNLPKTMPQRWDTADEEWYDGLDGMPYAGLYDLDMLLQADPWQPVWIVEGEKCADALALCHGEVATCAAGGAGGWPRIGADVNALRGRHCVVLKDDDAAGERYAQDILSSDLPSIAASVRVLTLDGAHDVYDWLKDGHTTDELRRLAAQTEPITACMPQSRMTSGWPHLAPPKCGECQNPDCMMARASLEALRQARAREDAILAVDNEIMTGADKVAAIALDRELTTVAHREHDAEGRPRIRRSWIATRLGVSAKTAGARLQRVTKTGAYACEKDTSDPQDTKIFYTFGPRYSQWNNLEKPSTGPFSHGGKRVPYCPDCHHTEFDLLARCANCGTIHKPSELPEGRILDDGTIDPRDLPDDGRTTVDDLIKEASRGAVDSPSPTHSPEILREGEVAVQVTHVRQNQRVERAAVLELAETLGFPTVQLNPAARAGGDRARWERFTAVASNNDLDAALAALQRKEAS
jgi:hypothetical protein